MKSALPLLFGCMTCVCLARDAAAQTIAVSCPKFFDDRHQAVACIEGVFSQDQYHFTLASLPPSNGFGPGLVFTKRLKRTSGTPPRFSETALSATVAGTTNKSWLVGGELTWVPPLPYKSKVGGFSLGRLTIAERLTIHLSATHRETKSLYFYGTGADSPAMPYAFAQEDTSVGATVRFPITPWLVVTGEGAVLDTKLPATGGVAAIKSGFDPASLPGIDTQPVYLRGSVGTATTFAFRSAKTFEELPSSDKPHFQRLLLFTLDNAVAYRWQQPTNGSRLAFQQFTYAGDERMLVHSVLRNMFPADRHRMAAYFCGGNKRRDECDFGQLAVKFNLTLTHTAASQQIPFYLLPTLGGSDIDSQVTLRGYSDYRFRDRDLALVQIEYGVPVFDPIGAFIFFDEGSVGVSPSDLSAGPFHHDAGLGLFLRVRGHMVAQVYYAAGGDRKWGYSFSKVF